MKENMKFKEGDIVFYTGEYKNCHGYRYKITKHFPGDWFDLELIDDVSSVPKFSVYQQLMSVVSEDLQISITDCNILVAKFMDWKIDNSFPDKDRVWKSPGGQVEMDTTLKFHKDWNWLMPVVKKLFEKDISIVCVNKCKNNVNYAKCFVYGDIDIAYENVVLLIKHYNENH